jgi:ABC-type antimicrobial peptide transport system permease subunit
MALVGVASGAIGGFIIARLIGSYVLQVEIPGLLPLIGAAVVLLAAATVASLLPAIRAARVDVMQALRME